MHHDAKPEHQYVISFFELSYNERTLGQMVLSKKTIFPYVLIPLLRGLNHTVVRFFLILYLIIKTPKRRRYSKYKIQIYDVAFYTFLKQKFRI